MKRTDASGNAANMFQDDTQPTTQVDASWLNAVQEEICSVIEDADAGDEELNAASTTQLKAAIQTMISEALATTSSRKNGMWLGTVNAGGTIYVSFPAPFPEGTSVVVVMEELNTSGSAARDNWMHLIGASEAGFYALCQGTNAGGNNTLDGFHWIAEALDV